MQSKGLPKSLLFTIVKKMEQLRKNFVERFKLSSTEWNLIDQHVVRKSLKKGSFFIEEGKICLNSGFVLEGVLRYFSYDAQGNDPTCYFSYENQYVVDPFSFKKHTPCGMNLQAVTKCDIAVISAEDDKQLRTVLPRWQEITSELLLDVSTDFANQKELLAMNASSRYEYFVNKFPTVAKRVPLQYVASYLGIKQPSLSRVRKDARTSKA
jgi:hypothetical protein